MKTRKMMVYKLVSTDPDGRFFSAYTTRIKSLEYKLGEKTVPKIAGTLLMAYSNLADISTTLHCGLILFEAEAEVSLDFPGDSTCIPRLSTTDMYACDEEIENFWKNIQSLKEEYTPYVFPKGTVFCTSITLTKRIGI